jgi:SprT protein
MTHAKKEGIIPVIDVPEGALFQMENGKIFQKGPRRRKRFECIEVKTGLHYTFSPVTEVKVVDN